MKKFGYPNHYEMKTKRLVALQNHDWKCVDCGEDAIVTHHADFSKDNHDVENLIPLCHSCHMKRHKIKNSGSNKKWNVARVLLSIEKTGLAHYSICNNAGITISTLNKLIKTGMATPKTIGKLSRYFGNDPSDYIDPLNMETLNNMWDES